MTLERRRLVRVPASTANLGPGFDVLAAALALHLEVEVARDRQLRGRHRPRRPARSRQPGRSRVRAAASGRRLRVPDRLARSRCPAASGRARRRSSRGCSPPTTSSSSTPTYCRLAVELEGHPDNVGGGAGGRVRALRPDRDPSLRAADGPRGDARRSRGVRPAPRRRARRSRPRCRWPTPCSTSPTWRCWCVGLTVPDWELIAAGLDDRLHQPRRAHLYPRSAELLERARGLGALGATISGAGPTVLVWSHYEQTGAVMDASPARPRAGRG